MDLRTQSVYEILHGKGRIDLDHPYIDDILFYRMLEKAAAELELFAIASLAQIQILHIENKQKVDNIKGSR